MKKFISFVLLFTFLVSSVARADVSIVNDKDLELVVKEVPKDLQKRLGKDYVLIQESYLRELEDKAAESEVLHDNIDEMVLAIKSHERYESQLQKIIERDNDHMEALNRYIDDQQKEIDRLQPTLWSKHKFLFGVLTGSLLTAGAVIGASQIK